MSAKSRNSENSQASKPPPDSGEFPTTEKDWNFRPIMEAFASVRREAPKGKKEDVLDDPNGRAITAAAFYEYARESAQLRKLCQEWIDLNSRLTLRNGKGWKQRLLEKEWKDACKPHLPNDPAPFFPEQLEDDEKEFNSDYFAYEEIETKLTRYGDSIGSGCLISQFRIYLAGGKAWTEISETERNQVTRAAWDDPFSDAPLWPSEVETEAERARAGRGIKKGERPFLTLSCRPEMPEAVQQVAENDRDRELEERHRFANVRRTTAAEQRRSDAVEAAWMHNEPDPRLPRANRRKQSTNDLREIDYLGHEYLVFRIPWYLTNEEITAQFAPWLKVIRPRAYKDFAEKNANAEISAPLIALRNLGARRILRDPSFVGRRKQEIAAAYWNAIGEDKGKNWDRRFAEAVKEARDRLRLWGLE